MPKLTDFDRHEFEIEGVLPDVTQEIRNNTVLADVTQEQKDATHWNNKWREEEDFRKSVTITGRSECFVAIQPFAAPVKDRRPVISQREKIFYRQASRKRRGEIFFIRKRQIQAARLSREGGVPHYAVEVAEHIFLHCKDIIEKSHEAIAAIVGCHEDTVRAVCEWLEKKGWLDWVHTRGTINGRNVRQANVYMIVDPATETLFDRVKRTMRPIWRDRPNRNSSGGDSTLDIYNPKQTEAAARLKEIRKAREAQLTENWLSTLKLST